MNKVSIIVPLYNQQEYVQQAVDSALAQTIPCEVIVVNDGSTDGSLEAVRVYEPPIKIVSQRNKGLASARNTGLMHATGSWILPLDADDILLPNCAERLLELAEERDADVMAGSFSAFGYRVGDVILMPMPGIKDFIEANRIGYSALIRKSALLEVGGYSPKMTWGYEDYHLWFDLLSIGKTIKTTQEILWHYRTKEVSMITEALSHDEELMAQIYKDFPNLHA